MTNEELNTALYEKLFAEQQDFKGWLVKQPPEEILRHAYEYVIREDIRCIAFLTLSVDCERHISSHFKAQSSPMRMPV